MLAIAAYRSSRGYISRVFLAKKEVAETLRKLAATRRPSERRESETRIRDQAALLDKARDAIIVRDLGDHVL